MARRPPAAHGKDEAAPSPGGLLRREREKLALSAAEVAGRLHLDAGIIKALEKDDYQQIASPTYARGYLAGYARLVGADSERIMALFNNIVPPELPAISPEVKPSIRVSSSHKAVRVLTCLIVLGLVALFLIWYRGHFSGGTMPVDDIIMDEKPPALAVPAAAPGPATDIASAAPVEAGASQAGQAPAPFVATLAGQAADETAPAQDPDQTAASAGLSLPVARPGQTGPPPYEIDEAASPLSAMAHENIADHEAETIIAPAIASGAELPDSLRLTFSDDSWVEIYDANDNRLFRDLALSGEEHLIEGAAPFRILFGFSPGVTAEFNGERIEHAGYSRHGIARFTLPEEQRP